ETPFACCDESAISDRYKQGVLGQVISGSAKVATDSVASPTNFPFKVVGFDGTISDDDVYAARPRICDLGYLRESYRTPEGTVGFRCPAEPPSLYVAKGGNVEDTYGKKCLCNSLLATVGYAKV